MKQVYQQCKVFLLVYLESSQNHILRIKVDPPPHGVDHRLRLLVDLLLHECREVPFHDLLDLHLQGCNLPSGIILTYLRPNNLINDL